MKKVCVVLIPVFVFSFALSFANSSSLPRKSEIATIVNANNQFAIDLLNQLNNGDGNIFFSPFSLFDALSMTYVGARGETKSQMAKVLHIALSNENFNSAFLKITSDIEFKAKRGEYILNIANALWVQENFHFLKSFLLITKKYYDGDTFSVNFSNPNVVNKINNWAAEQTNGRIKEIVGRIDPLTRLILTNAVYFKGEWASAFKSSATKPTTFYVNPQKKIEVSMMYQEAKFNYMDNGSLQAIEMPYKGNLSMIVLLPRDRYGMAKLEKSLSSVNLKRWISEMMMQKVKVYFPRFELRTGYDLGKALKFLGMSDAFGNADFSGIDGQKDLHISKVVQKAYVKVNEEGTEAAAVTAVEMVLTCAPGFNPPEIPIFRADHPFIFFIVDKTTNNSDGIILFVGKITTPKYDSQI